MVLQAKNPQKITKKNKPARVTYHRNKSPNKKKLWKLENDKQQEQNFHKDKRLMEQMLTSEEFQKTLETMIGKAIEKVTKGNM